jgi:hypothetical protein
MSSSWIDRRVFGLLLERGFERVPFRFLARLFYEVKISLAYPGRSDAECRDLINANGITDFFYAVNIILAYPGRSAALGSFCC